jgi:hypothetical protein
MTKAQAEFLFEACENAGIECEIREGYSGRGMYGEETYGIVLKNPVDLVSAVIEHMRGITDSREMVAVPLFRALRVDGMGRDFIVY